MLKNEQKSAKTLPQKLAGLNKGRSAWGENLACGVAWQSVLLGCNGAWQGALNLATHNTAWRGEFDNETAKHSKIQRHGNKIQHNEFIKANTANGTHSTTNSTKYSEFVNANNAKRYFVSKTIHDTASTANSMWQTFAGKTANSAWQAGRKWCLQAKQSVAERQIQHRENGAVLAGEVGKAKMGQCLGGGLLSLSLSLSLSRCSHL